MDGSAGPGGRGDRRWCLVGSGPRVVPSLIGWAARVVRAGALTPARFLLAPPRSRGRTDALRESSVQQAPPQPDELARRLAADLAVVVGDDADEAVVYEP